MASIRLNDAAPAPIAPGQDLLGAMLDAGQPALYLCMAGSCGRCRVRVEAGREALAPCSAAEEAHGCASGQRLACQATLLRDDDIHLIQPA